MEEKGEGGGEEGKLCVCVLGGGRELCVCNVREKSQEEIGGKC